MLTSDLIQETRERVLIVTLHSFSALKRLNTQRGINDEKLEMRLERMRKRRVNGQVSGQHMTRLV